MFPKYLHEHSFKHPRAHFSAQTGKHLLRSRYKLSLISKIKTVAVRKIRQSHLEKRRKIQIWNKTEGEGWGRSLQENKCSGKMTTWGRDEQENRIKTQLAGRDWRLLLCQEGGQYESEMGCARIGSETREKGFTDIGWVRQDTQNPMQEGKQWTLPLPCSLLLFSFLPFLFLLHLYFLSYLNPAVIHTSTLASPNWALLSSGCHNSDENHVLCFWSGDIQAQPCRNAAVQHSLPWNVRLEERRRKIVLYIVPIVPRLSQSLIGPVLNHFKTQILCVVSTIAGDNPVHMHCPIIQHSPSPNSCPNTKSFVSQVCNSPNSYREFGGKCSECPIKFFPPVF